jgi:hypothetical protein
MVMSKSKIIFDPVPHTYTNIETKRIYTSVTQVIGQYEKEFDELSISQAISLQSDKRKKTKYIGLTQEEILQNWHEENRIANEYGKKIHDLLEQYNKRNKFYFPQSDEEREILNAYDDLNIDYGQKQYCERILWSDEDEVAGMTDHLVDIDTDFFDINDYKSNKVINYYSPFRNRLLHPLEFLEDCQFNVYALQLSTYAYFYEKESKRKCRSLKLLYYDRMIKKFQIIYVPYMKMEVVAMLKHFRKHRNENQIAII